jgi:hypothetical protein
MHENEMKHSNRNSDEKMTNRKEKPKAKARDNRRRRAGKENTINAGTSRLTCVPSNLGSLNHLWRSPPKKLGNQGLVFARGRFAPV